MRRAAAILLVTLIGLSPIGAAWFAGSDSKLPACCRRDGRHHCALVDAARPQGPVLGARCPYFPSVRGLPTHSGPGVAQSGLAAVSLAGHTTVKAQPESGNRAIVIRSLRDRGPPNSLS
jgi:hypothetical protein